MAKTYTTREVAEAIGISEHTLYRWLSDRALREPRRTVTLGKREIRLWTDKDIERVRTFLGQKRRNYGALREALAKWPVPKSVATQPQGTTFQPPEFRAREKYQVTHTGPNFVHLYGEFRPDDELLTPEQLAERLQVKKSTIYEMTRHRGKVRAGKRHHEPLPYRKVGKYVRFIWREVCDWIDKQKAVEVVSST